MSEKPVRIGLIGCGQIAQQHLRNYSKIPGVQVVACADIKKEAADTTAQTWNIPNVYYTGQEMLKRDDLDAVDVCLHNNLHVSGTVAVLESGRHCYCEKPMAGTYRDALTMYETAKKTGKMLHIQLAFLYEKETRAAKELIEAGELGELYHARSTGFRRRGRPFVDGYGSECFVQPKYSNGGAMYDMGVYHLSQLLYLMGNPTPKRVVGRTYQKIEMDPKRREISQYDVEELGLGFVHFENGITMDIIEAWSINLGGFEGSSLVGSNAGVCLSPFGYFRNYGNLEMNATANLEQAAFRWTNVHGDKGMYNSSQAHWIAALRGECELLPTAEIALNTMLISECVFQSSKLDREVTADEVKQASVSRALPL